MIPVEKPGSPSEILEHHGVKGMKWGVRRESRRAGRQAGSSAAAEARRAGASRVESKKIGRKAGHEAAKETSAKLRGTTANLSANRAFNQKFPTSATRTRAIKQARVQEQAMRLKAASETNPAKRDKLVKEWADSPDRAIALRTTRGEKVVLGVLAGALAVPTLGGSVAALGGYSGASVAIRRGIERGQAKRARQ